MAANDTVQPALQGKGVFDEILGSIVAGIQLHQKNSDDNYNAAVAAANPGISSQTLLLLGLVAVGLYLAFEN